MNKNFKELEKKGYYKLKKIEEGGFAAVYKFKVLKKQDIIRKSSALTSSSKSISKYKRFWCWLNLIGVSPTRICSSKSKLSIAIW